MLYTYCTIFELCKVFWSLAFLFLLHSLHKYFSTYLSIIAHIEKDGQNAFFLPCTLPHAPEKNFEY